MLFQSPGAEYTGGPLRPGRRPVPAQRPSSMYSRLPSEEPSPEKPASWSSMEELGGVQQAAPLSPGTRKKKVAPPPPRRTTPVRPSRPHSITVTAESSGGGEGAALSMTTPQGAQPSGAPETVHSPSAEAAVGVRSDLEPPRPAPRPHSPQRLDSMEPPELPPRSPSPMAELAGEVATQARKKPTIIRPGKTPTSEEAEVDGGPVYMNLVFADAGVSDLETSVTDTTTGESSTIESPKKRPTIIRPPKSTAESESMPAEEKSSVLDVRAVVADIPEQSKKLKPTIIRPSSTSKEYPAVKRAVTPEPCAASPAQVAVDVNANVAKSEVKGNLDAEAEITSPELEVPVSSSPVKPEVKVAVKREITPEPRGPEDSSAGVEVTKSGDVSHELSPALEIRTNHVATKAAVVVPVAGVTSDTSSTEPQADTLTKDLDKILTISSASARTPSHTEEVEVEAEGLKEDFAKILQQKPSEPPPVAVEELLAQSKKPEFKPMVVPELEKPVLAEATSSTHQRSLSPKSPESPASKPPTRPKPPVKPKPGLAPKPLLRRPGGEDKPARPASMYEERMLQKTKANRPTSLADEKSSFVMSAALKTKLGQEVISQKTELKSSSAPTSPVAARKSYSPAGSEGSSSPSPGKSYKSPGSPGAFRKSWNTGEASSPVKKLDPSRLALTPEPFQLAPGSPGSPVLMRKSWEPQGETPSSPISPKPLLSPKPKLDKGTPPPLSPKPSRKPAVKAASPGDVPIPKSPVTKGPPPPLSPKPARKPPMVSVAAKPQSPMATSPIKPVAMSVTSSSEHTVQVSSSHTEVSSAAAAVASLPRPPLKSSPQSSPPKSEVGASPSGGLYNLIKRKMSGEIQPPEIELESPAKDIHIVHPHFTAPASPQPTRAATASSTPSPAPSMDRRDSFEVLATTTVTESEIKIGASPKKHRPAPLGIPESIVEGKVDVVVKSPNKPTPPATPTRISSLPLELREDSVDTPSSPTHENIHTPPPTGASPPLPAKDPSAKSPTSPIHPISPLARDPSDSDPSPQPTRVAPQKPVRHHHSSGSSSQDDVPVPSRPAPPKPTRTPKRSGDAAPPRPAPPDVSNDQDEVFDEVVTELNVAPARPQPPKGAIKSKAVARAAAASVQLHQEQQQKKSPPKPPVRTSSLADQEV